MRFPAFPALAALCCGAALLAACDKGTDLNVDLPNVGSIDTRYTDTPLEAATVRVGVLQTLKSEHYLAGRYTDNVAGTTTALGVLNYQPSTIQDSLPARYRQPVLDSVVLTQLFDAVYGRANAPAVFNLFELAAPLSPTAVYTSATVPGLKPVPVALGVAGRLDGRLLVPPTKADSLAGVFRYVPDPTLRLTLYNRRTNATAGEAFSNRLFEALRRNPAFGQADLDAVFGGLVVAPASAYDQAVVSFVPGGNAELRFFFRDVQGRNPRARHSYLLRPRLSQSTGPGGPNDPRYYTYLTTDLGPSPLAPLADPTQQVSAAALGGLAYAQDGTGLGVRVRIPEALANQLIANKQAINRAELYLPVKPFTNAVLPFVEGLSVSEVDSRNQVLQRTNGLLLTDRLVQRDGAPQTGTGFEAVGLLYGANTSAPYYLVPITGYLQAYLNNLGTRAETVPDGLLLQATALRQISNGTLALYPFGLTLNRSVLDVGSGGSSGRGGPRLRVYYSQLR